MSGGNGRSLQVALFLGGALLGGGGAGTFGHLQYRELRTEIRDELKLLREDVGSLRQVYGANNAILEGRLGAIERELEISRGQVFRNLAPSESVPPSN